MRATAIRLLVVLGLVAGASPAGAQQVASAAGDPSAIRSDIGRTTERIATAYPGKYPRQ